MTQIILRQDQQDLKSGVYQNWGAGNKIVMGVLPTGGGKSVIMSDIVLDIDRDRSKQTVIAHRNELVSQMSHHIARRDIPHRIIGSSETVRSIMASHKEEFGTVYVHPTANCAVAGIDTINARSDVLKDWFAQNDYFFGDEGHHFLRGNKWGKGIDLFTRARGLLMTASPARPDGQGLGSDNDGLADAMVIGPAMRDLIDMGALADYEIVCPQSDLEVGDDDISPSGDYSPRKLKAAAEKSRIVGDVVREYTRYALFKRAICFATDVETANKIAKQFNEAGIRAASVSAKTPTTVREDYIKRFKRGEIYVLVNVDLFDEGFDVPACDCVIMARPTASLVKYLQMFGRALRTAVGKLYGLIIDHVSNVVRHGLPDKPRAWSLERREKRGKQEKDPDEIPLKRCGNVELPCCKPYPAFSPVCTHCGWSPPLPEPGGRTIEVVAGDLVLLDREALEAKRRAMFMEDAQSLASRVAQAAGGAAAEFQKNKHMAKIAAQKALREAIEQWAGIGLAEGHADSWQYRQFYHLMGCDVMDALRSDRAREEFETMTETVRGWIRKRGYAV